MHYVNYQVVCVIAGIPVRTYGHLECPTSNGKIIRNCNNQNNNQKPYNLIIGNCVDITQQGRTEDALTLKGDEGRGVSAISFGEVTSNL